MPVLTRGRTLLNVRWHGSGRTLAVATDGMDALNGIRGAVSAAFLDIHENVRPNARSC